MSTQEHDTATRWVQSAGRETVACHVCGGLKVKPFLAARGYAVVTCVECGLVFVNPQPTDAELSQLYATHDQGDQWRIYEQHFNHAVGRQILRFRACGSVLDVGCGSGNFLRVMRDRGFSAVGIERSESGWRYAVEAHGLDVFHGSVEEFLENRIDSPFDVITLLNVLEHLKHPQDTVVSLSKVLKRGGLLLVVVPDARLHTLLATFRKALGSNDPFWMEAAYKPIVAIDPPFHLTCFEPRTLRPLLERSGYRVLKIANAPVIFNPQLWKRLSKLAVAGLGKSLEIFSLRRVVLGYSTMAIAERR